MKKITRNRCNCGKPNSTVIVDKKDGDDTASEIKSK